MQPMTAAIIIPNAPDCVPISLDMVFSFKTDKINPIINRIDNMEGKIFSNDLHAFFSADLVFSRFLKKEKISNNNADEYKTTVNIYKTSLQPVLK